MHDCLPRVDSASVVSYSRQREIKTEEGDFLVFSTEGLRQRFQSLYDLSCRNDESLGFSQAAYSRCKPLMRFDAPQIIAEQIFLDVASNVASQVCFHRQRDLHKKREESVEANQLFKKFWRSNPDSVDRSERVLFEEINQDLRTSAYDELAIHDVFKALLGDWQPETKIVIQDARDFCILCVADEGLAKAEIKRAKQVLLRTKEITKKMLGADHPKQKEYIVLMPNASSGIIAREGGFAGVHWLSKVNKQTVGISIVLSSKTSSEQAPSEVRRSLNVREYLAHESAHNWWRSENKLPGFVNEGYAQLVSALANDIPLIYLQRDVSEGVQLRRVEEVIQGKAEVQLEYLELYHLAASIFATIFSLGNYQEFGLFLQELNNTGKISAAVQNVYGIDFDELQACWRAQIKAKPSWLEQSIAFDCVTGEIMPLGRKEIDEAQKFRQSLPELGPIIDRPPEQEMTADDPQKNHRDNSDEPVEEVLNRIPESYRQKSSAVFAKAVQANDWGWFGDEDFAKRQLGDRNRGFEESLVELLNGDYDWWLPDAQVKDEVLQAVDKILVKACLPDQEIAASGVDWYWVVGGRGSNDVGVLLSYLFSSAKHGLFLTGKGGAKYYRTDFKNVFMMENQDQKAIFVCSEEQLENLG